LEAKVNRAMIEISKLAVAVCDSSKFGKRSLSLIAPTSSLQRVITDSGVSKADLNALKKSGVEVTVV
jgi:DeoR family transcriptional regulator of aga operon